MQKSALWFALGGMICLNACGDSDSTGASNYTERGGATVDSVKTVGNRVIVSKILTVKSFLCKRRPPIIFAKTKTGLK